MTPGLDAVVFLGDAESSSTRRLAGTCRQCSFLWRLHAKLRRSLLEGSMGQARESSQEPRRQALHFWERRLRTVTGLAQMRRSCC